MKNSYAVGFCGNISMRGAKEYVKLAIPSTLMCCFDIWIYTAILIMSSQLGFIENGTQTILFNLSSAVYAVAIGFGNSSCYFVGKNIGKGRVDKAKLYATLSYVYMQAINLIFTVIFLAAPSMVLGFYTKNRHIIRAGIEPLYVIAIGHLIDSS